MLRPGDKQIIIKSGGEPVAVLLNPSKEEVKHIKDWYKKRWPEDRITTKEIIGK